MFLMVLTPVTDGLIGTEKCSCGEVMEKTGREKDTQTDRRQDLTHRETENMKQGDTRVRVARCSASGMR